MNPRLPGITDRLAVVGRTGSGKTHFAMYILSRQNFSEFPWVVLDFKRDDFNDIRGAKRIGYTLPDENGLYIVQPRIDEKKQLNDFLWKIWEEGNIGVYVDEGYMINKMESDEPFESILTQGRSKHIPMINLTQRPVFVSRFVFSEASFVQIFDLLDSRDYETVEGFTPAIPRNLPDFYSSYYDVARKQLSVFKPAPNKKEILDSINKQLYTRKI